VANEIVQRAERGKGKEASPRTEREQTQSGQKYWENVDLEKKGNKKERDVRKWEKRGGTRKHTMQAREPDK